MIRTILLLSLAGLLQPPVAYSADAQDGHYQAAAAFYDEAKLDDPDAVSRAVANILLRLQPSLAPHREVLEAYAREVIESPKYTSARIGVYMELFGEEELRTLAWLYRHATFRKFREQRLSLVRRTTEVTMALFRNALPDLKRRIRERRQKNKPSPAD